jgi:aspartate aminotransferase-like enzyme
MPLEVDEWELDWVFSGVQKAWMCPPGLMLAGVSERAMHASKSNTMKRFYFDLGSMSEAARRGGTATTGALSLLYALDAALDAMLDEGMEAVWARHAHLGQCFRDGLAAMGVRILADPVYASSSVTAFHTPGGQTAEEFQERIDTDSGIAIATAQGPQGSTLNRVGHMGWVNQPELEATLEAIRNAMDAA